MQKRLSFILKSEQKVRRPQRQAWCVIRLEGDLGQVWGCPAPLCPSAKWKRHLDYHLYSPRSQRAQNWAVSSSHFTSVESVFQNIAFLWRSVSFAESVSCLLNINQCISQNIFRKFTPKYVSKHAWSHKITQKHWFQAKRRSPLSVPYSVGALENSPKLSRHFPP